MSRIDVKAMVREAVGGEWEGFCVRHPALARMVDRELMVEQCLRDLRESPEFMQAQSQVEMAGLAQNVLQELVVKVVKGVVRGL